MITCVFENKRKASLRHVTVDALLVKNNQILLVKRASHLSLHPNKYALPGGFLDRDETAEEGVLREMKEETGYQGQIISLFRIITKPDRKGEDRQNIGFVYLVKALKKVSQPDKEVKKIVWADLDNLPQEKEFAFDHYETIKLYLKYQKKKFPLPKVS